MIAKIFHLLVISIIIIGLLYSGTCIYANFFHNAPGEYDRPSAKRAQYEITIRNTNNVLYTDGYEAAGTKITLQGYWELADDRYIYRPHTLTLDRQTFGAIIIRLRGLN